MDKNTEFSTRFAKICGTSEAADIQRLLNIRYQTARNYLGGRLPSAAMLISISEQTSCSIDWLLTGRGKMFIDSAERQNTPLPTGKMEAFVRRICADVFDEMTGSVESPMPRVVLLQSDEVMSETVEALAPTLTGE